MANLDIVQLWGTTNRALPGIVQDNTIGPLRLSRRGEAAVQPYGQWRTARALEGTYFRCQNNTIDPATTLAGHAAPVLADLYTKPLIHMINNSTTLLAELDYIEIEVITAGASGTSDNWAAECDTGANRYSSGTVETFGVVNPNMQSPTTAALVVKGGPFVATAATANQRKMGHGVFRPSIALTGDKYVFRFGDRPQVGANVVASAITHHEITMPPVLLGSTDQFLLHLYAPSQSGAAIYKVRAAWSER